MNPARILLGYLIAPVVGTLALIFLNALFGGSLHLREFPAILLIYGVFPYLIATLFFVPVLSILKRARKFGWGYFVVIGGIGGVVVGLTASVISETNGSLYLGFMFSSAVSSLVFYKIATSNS